LLFHTRSIVRAALQQSLTHWNKLPVRGRWLVNSHPKAGTFLPRNILMHFNSGALHQHILFYDTFYDVLRSNFEPCIYTGHVPYSLLRQSRDSVGPLQSILLIRHPCAVALALARAFYDRNTTRPDHIHLREHESFAGIVVKIVTGYELADVTSGPLAASLADFSADWLGSTHFTIRFEDLTKHLAGPDDALVAFLAPVIEAMFSAVPDDAAARIRAGADAAISATYSRTATWASRNWSPDDVYGLLPRADAERLRGIAAQLGYSA
jgi:hypothetical protein